MAVCLLLMAPIVIVVILAFSGAGYLQFPPTSFSLRWFARLLPSATRNGARLCTVVQRDHLRRLPAASPRWSVSSPLMRSCAARFRAKSCCCRSAAADHRADGDHFDRDVFPGGALAFGRQPGLDRHLPCGHRLARGVVDPAVVVARRRSAFGTRRFKLGASRARLFLRVVVPLSAPGLISAALFAFLASFDELIISLFLTGIRANKPCRCASGTVCIWRSSRPSPPSARF